VRFIVDAQLPPGLARYLTHRHGTPPQIVWVTCGNTTNASLNRVFTQTFPSALQLLANGETIVEITEAK